MMAVSPMILVWLLLSPLARQTAEPPGVDDVTVATDLSRIYDERKKRLEFIREKLSSGEAPTSRMIEELLREPAELAELDRRFEELFTARLEAWKQNEERRRSERKAQEAAEPEGPAQEPTQEVADPSIDNGEIEPVTLSDANISESLHPEALGDLLYSLERYAEALAAYEAAPAGEDGRTSEWLLYRRAACLEKTSDYDRARDAYQATIDQYPDGVWTALCRLGLSSVELEKRFRNRGGE